MAASPLGFALAPADSYVPVGISEAEKLPTKGFPVEGAHWVCYKVLDDAVDFVLRK